MARGLGVGRHGPRNRVQEWYGRLLSPTTPAVRSQIGGTLVTESVRGCSYITYVTARLPKPCHSGLRRVKDASRLGLNREDASETKYEDEKFRRACDALDASASEGFRASTDTLYHLLKGCIANKSLAAGRKVHNLVIRSGHETSPFLASHIIRMYASLGSLQEACEVFSRLSLPDKFAWGSIITAHCELGKPEQGVELYKQVRKSSSEIDDPVVVAVLQACARTADLASGRIVHADVMSRGCDSNVFVGSTLVDMYSKCGSLEESRSVFNRLPVKNVVTWNAMISGYIQQKDREEAFCLYKSMQKDGVIPDSFTFLFMLEACESVGGLERCKEIHAEVLERNFEQNVFVGSGLVDKYSRYGSLEDAYKVFRRLPSKNLVTWNAMIAGYAHHGLSSQAMELYASMQREHVNPDAVTFSCMLKACANVGAIETGRDVHSRILERGLQKNDIIGGRLVDMYAKCGKLGEAQAVFDSLPEKNVVTWNALISGYGEHNDIKMAIQCFEKMQACGVRPDEATFTCLLVACSHARLVDEGYRFFRMIGQDQHVRPAVEHFTCMVDLLGRAGRLDEAESLLSSMPFEQDGVGWMSLLTACKIHSDTDRGKRCFDRLIELKPQQASAYVLMSDIYTNAKRWEESTNIQNLRQQADAFKVPARAWTEVKNKVHEFIVGDERDDVSLKLRSMNLLLLDQGHASHTELLLKAASEHQKKDALCGHAEKLALAFGLLNTPDGTPLLVTKNLRMCNDCHSGTKFLSRVERREITVRDAHQVHHFVNGACSCGDVR